MDNPHDSANFNQWIKEIDSFESKYSKDITPEKYFGFSSNVILEAEKRLQASQNQNIAYFSMEFGLAPSIYNSFVQANPMVEDNQFFTHEVFSNSWLCDYLFKIQIDKMLDIPIYGGGLGVLAGDMIKSAADLGYPFVGIGILWSKGYFKQSFWYKHGQIPEEMRWDPYSYPGLIPLNKQVEVRTQEGSLFLKLWKYYVYSHDQKNVCPLILLDSNIEENCDSFKQITGQLYRSDSPWWKINQRLVLGIGGMKALSCLGYAIDKYHLNEGHAAFSLAEKYVNLADKNLFAQEAQKFVFTCHTPVAAGHDRFGTHDVEKVFAKEYFEAVKLLGQEKQHSGQINLTYMCLNNCRKVNAVAQKHGEVMRIQFPKFAKRIESITNGVHTHTWISESFQQLFDKYSATFGQWRLEPENLSKVVDLEKDELFRADVFEAHQKNKRQLAQVLMRWGLRDDVFTVGWARRIAGYKRPALIFQDIQKIVCLAREIGPIQIVMAGKAHPNDDIGAAHIDKILDHIDQLNGHRGFVRVLLLENYDTYFGKLLTNCVDVWLNNPLPPFEASGTSGMKAILNGVLQLSTLDGWVVEAEHEKIGWIFGYQHEGLELGQETDSRMKEDSEALYAKLEEVVKLYYGTFKDNKVNVNSAWIDKMIHCIKASAFFSTQRAISEYHQRLWTDPKTAEVS